MAFPLVLIAAIVILILQLLLCFRCKNILRYAPLGVLGVMEAGSWSCFYLVRPGFYAYIIGLIGLYWLGAGVLAWAIYGIVQLVQKRRK